MDKLKMQTPNKVNENIERITALFPNCVTESIGADGKPTRVVDFDLLRQELSGFAVEGGEERYQFTWADKKKSILLANSPISKTLRPVRDDETVPTGSDSSGKPYCSSGSVNFDTTKNLYIEGDNLDVLKLLQETYMGKVKMIYIDPPYNTGNDFVYEDDFAMSAEEYFERSGAEDEDGNRLFQNNDSNGRFHTDWLNMIYPRLKLARDLLTDDGVVFISIDDNEVHNLRKVCDEVFGAGNFVADFIWRKKGTSTNVQNALVSALTDHILCFSKSDILCLNRRKTSVADRQFPFKDNEGNYRTSIIEKKDAGGYARETMKFPILGITPRDGKRWQIGEKTAHEYEKRNRFTIENGIIKLKIYDFEDGDSFSANPNLLLDCGSSDSASKAVNVELFGAPELFSNPKPIELLKHLINLGANETAIILDFFSGSGTTAHAVMQLNAEDGGNRKFIMVQLPEETSEKSEAFKAGYKNICEIGKERIRRAGRKIAGENQMTAPNLDIGFRVLKVDSSNMKPVFYNPDAVTQDLLSSQNLADNIKDDRTPEDLLFQVMLDMGVDLSSPITVETLGGKKVFTVGSDNLICCFDKDITKETVTEIAKAKPLYAVFRDSSFARDDIMVSFDQIFETYSPTTTRRVI